MESKIGWIDFSPTHKNRIKQFISIMNKGGVVDELGVGIVRDGLSNLIFPGFSTLYTRAKYFFITPYLLHDRNKAANREKDGLKYFKRREIECNKAVKTYYSEQDRTIQEESYFGKIKQEGDLERQPSSIYWNGIRTFKLIDTEMSLEQLLHERPQDNDIFISPEKYDDKQNEMEGTFEEGEDRTNSIIKVTVPNSILEELRQNGLTLTDDEADELTEHIIDNTPDSLVAALLQDKKLWDCYCASSSCKRRPMDTTFSNNFLNFTEQAVEQKLVSDKTNLYHHLILAHDFVYSIHGAHIAYNIALRESIKEKNLIPELRDYGILWKKEYKKKMIDPEGFNIKECLLNPNLPITTKSFLLKYDELVREANDWTRMETEAIKLAKRQEINNKGAQKSRFLLMNNQEELDRITEELLKSQWIGLDLINYRYTSTLSVLKDIYKTKER